MKKPILMLLYLLAGAPVIILAQDETQTEQNQQVISKTEGDRTFLLTGYGFVGYEKEGEDQGTFGPAGFSPIFLWRKSNKLFFESELEVAIEDGETMIGLEYATLHYVVNKYLTFSAGKFLSPFGTFAERIHPAWINKFSEKPLGFSEEGAMVGSMGELGLELRGGSQLGNSKINYVAYLTNGPTLVTDDPMMAGQLMYDNLGDNNNNKAIGGRLGFLPFSNSSLEVGLSGQKAIVGDKDDSKYENIGAQLFSGDISYVQKVGFMNMDIKGQYNQVIVDKADYLDTAGMNITIGNNTSSAYYAQLALRPVVRNKFLKNIELAGRYSVLNLPDDAMWAGDKTQIGVGLNYWLSWNSVLKIDYLITQQEGEEDEGAIFVQLAFGF